MIQQRQARERDAALRLQTFWRCLTRRIKFRLQKKSIVTLQSACRRKHQQIVYYILRRSSSTIQSQWRGHRHRYAFHLIRGATIFLQRMWRSHLLLQQKKNRMATRLQSCVRGVAVRQRLRQQEFSVTKIGSWFKTRLERINFLQCHRSAVVIQIDWRRHHEEKRYSELRRKLVQVQSALRRWSQRRRYLGLRGDIILTQKTVRGLLKRRQYFRLRNAAIRMQRKIRQKVRMAVHIQAWVRGKLVQRVLKVSRMSAILIQRNWLLYAQTRMAIRLQSWYRCNIGRFKYLLSLFSIVMLQATWRGHRQRSQLLELKKNVLYLETCYRNKVMAKKHLAAAVLMQCLVRRAIAKRKRKQPAAAILLQSLARRAVAKRKRLALLSQKQKAEKLLQVRARRKMRLKSLHERQEGAAVFLQRAYRKSQIQKCMQEQQATIVKQQFTRWRAQAGKIREERIQAIRTHRKLRLRQICSAITIQKTWRSHTCRLRFVIRRDAANVLAATFQAFIARELYLGMRSGFTYLQSHWRGASCRRRYRAAHLGLLSFQRLARRILKKRTKAAILVQSRWRLAEARSMYNMACSAIVSIQSWWRGKSSRSSYMKVYRGFVSFQTKIKLYFERKAKKALHSKVATVIQTSWRMVEARTKYREAYFAAILVQTRWRMQSARSSYIKFHHGIASLQIMIKEQYEMKTRAAVVLQSYHRMAEARSNYSRTLDGFVKFQSQWRGFHCRTSFLRLHHIFVVLRAQAEQWKVIKTNSAIQLQKSWRLHSSRLKYSQLRARIVLVQSLWRGYICSCSYQRLRHGLLLLQGLARKKYQLKMIGALLLQASWRKLIMQRAFLQLQCCTICVQSQWRRKSCTLFYANALSSSSYTPGKLEKAHHAACFPSAPMLYYSPTKSVAEKKVDIVLCQFASRSDHSSDKVQDSSRKKD
jgi:hypothetical protein